VSGAGRTNRPRRRRFFSGADIGRVSPGGADAGIAEGAERLPRVRTEERVCPPGRCGGGGRQSEWWPVTVSERSASPGNEQHGTLVSQPKQVKTKLFYSIQSP